MGKIEQYQAKPNKNTSMCIYLANLHVNISLCGSKYCEISIVNITKSQNYNVSRLVLQLPLYNQLKPGVNTLRPRQNGDHFPNDIFKCIFLNENVWVSLKISLKFVPKGPINNISALVQIMAWRRPGDKPLSEPMMVSLPTHICVTQPQWVKSKMKMQLEQRQQGMLQLHWSEWSTIQLPTMVCLILEVLWYCQIISLECLHWNSISQYDDLSVPGFYSFHGTNNFHADQVTIFCFSVNLYALFH